MELTHGYAATITPDGGIAIRPPERCLECGSNMEDADVEPFSNQMDVRCPQCETLYWYDEDREAEPETVAQ